MVTAPNLAKKHGVSVRTNTWQQIWAKDAEINRAYIADFDVYGANAQNGANSEVTIFLGVNE